jgi:hypothetical protein
MHKFIFVLLFVCFVVFAAACSKSSNSNAPERQQGGSPNADNKPPQVTNTSPNQPKDKNTPAQVVTVSAGKVTITGGAGDAVIELKIADGYHINANPASEKNLIPTTVEIASANGITAEKPVYPQALVKKFSFSDKELAVYEKQAAIKVKVKASGAKGEKIINGTLRYQACDDEVCYPPTKMDLMMSASVN